TVARVILVIIPGPSVLFIVGRALAHGRRAALASVAGNTTGAALVVVVVALGFGAIAARSIAVFTALKLVGAAYLVYLGVQTIRKRGDLVGRIGEPAGPAGGRLYWQGVVVGFTNPKVLVFFAAVLPQFVDTAAGNPTTQMLVLGLLFAMIAAVLDSAWGLAAGTAREWLATSPGRLRWMGGIGGACLIVMGAGLALSGRKDLRTRTQPAARARPRRDSPRLRRVAPWVSAGRGVGAGRSRAGCGCSGQSCARRAALNRSKGSTRDGGLPQPLRMPSSSQ